MAFSFSPKIVTNGLVLALDAANARSYVSGSTVWNDLTANNINGSLINGPIYSSANAGIIQFDGVDDYFETIIPQYQTFTVCIWVYPISGNGLFLYGNSGSFPILLINYDLSGGIRLYSYNYYQTFNSVLSINNWSMISVVASNTSNVKQLFVNGVLVGSNSYMYTIQDFGLFRLGVQNFIGYGNCRIASTQMYNRALSPTEVLQNYNATKSRFNLT